MKKMKIDWHLTIVLVIMIGGSIIAYFLAKH